MLKVLTYNIHKGFSRYNRDFVLHEIREQFESLDVDIVFLQEIQGEHQHHESRIAEWPEESQFEFLADQIWPHYAYGKNAIHSKGHHGNAILSKHSIDEWTNINLSRFKRASRSMLHGIVTIPGLDVPLHLICVHLELLGFERSRQMDILQSHIEKHIPPQEPIILAGDFNDWNGRLGKRLEQKLEMQESFREEHGNYARTFPSSWPMLQMDRIYYRGIKLFECECFNAAPWRTLSDHLPLYARFTATELDIKK